MSRILIIEDNPTNLQLMSYLLRAFGHTPLEAEDGEEGLALARREALDLIICDMALPKLDGYEVARQLKGDAVLREVPLVAVTAFAMVGDREKVLAAGFDGYIAKPINPQTFVAEVEAFLPSAQHGTARSPHAMTAAPETTVPHRATILMVDNTFDNVSVVRAALEPFGYQTLAASGVAEGLALARQHLPDLILSDVDIAGESGYALIQAVKDDPQLRSIPFVFISSTNWIEMDLATALRVGAADFITRPIEPQVLLKKIEGYLKK